jgi:hypothetical protein
MRRAGGQFTLWEMMVAVAVCAGLLVIFPVLVVLLLFPATGMPVAGYALARAWRWDRIRGAMIGGAIGFPACQIIAIVVLARFRGAPDMSSPVPWLILLGMAALGMAWGGLVGSWAWSFSRRNEPNVLPVRYRPHFARRRYRRP